MTCRKKIFYLSLAFSDHGMQASPAHQTEVKNGNGQGCSVFVSCLQTALRCLCSSVHTQSTYEHPASYFVFLRAPAGLDSQVFPVPRQELHPLDTILSPNYLNRRGEKGKNLGGLFVLELLGPHLHTDKINTFLHARVLCSRSVFSSASLSPYPPCPAAPLPQGLRVCTGAALASAGTQGAAQLSGVDGAGQGGVHTHALHQWSRRTRGRVPKGVFSRQMMPVLNEEGLAACSCW